MSFVLQASEIYQAEPNLGGGLRPVFDSAFGRVIESAGELRRIGGEALDQMFA
jgi:hypothetical protein